MTRSKWKTACKSIALITALALLAACSAKGASSATGNIDDNRIGTAAPQGATMIASIPERDVYLYADPQDQAILTIGDTQQSMDWQYSTVRGVLPVLNMQDYDRDGDDELAVVLELGSGTGLLIDELRVVEYEKDGQPTERFTDRAFAEEDYMAQLRTALSFRKVEREGGWFGEISAGGKTSEVNLSKFVEEYGAEAIQDRLGYGAIVYFHAEQDGLRMRAAIGLVIDGPAEPQYIGNIEAAINYADGEFKLEQPVFTVD